MPQILFQGLCRGDRLKLVGEARSWFSKVYYSNAVPSCAGVIVIPILKYDTSSNCANIWSINLVSMLLQLLVFIHPLRLHNAWGQYAKDHVGLHIGCGHVDRVSSLWQLRAYPCGTRPSCEWRVYFTTIWVVRYCRSLDNWSPSWFLVDFETSFAAYVGRLASSLQHVLPFTLDKRRS